MYQSLNFVNVPHLYMSWQHQSMQVFNDNIYDDILKERQKERQRERQRELGYEYVCVHICVYACEVKGIE